MNNKRLSWAVLLSALMSLFVFSACSSDDDDEDFVAPETSTLEVKRFTLPNPGYGPDNWIYFSLSEGKIVEGINESNRAEKMNWDLAFYRYNIRTNGGLSGKGQGGAMDTGKTDMKQVTAVPAGKFTTDVMGSVTASMESFPPPTVATPLNEVLGKAMDFQGPPPTYTPNNHIYVVKTADGKYAKIKVESFYNDEGKSGYLTFSYAYQPDGSKIL